jgi:crotonobetainyl-CoA:carnitine CoA-transferase CaiB-like acyl-CoA transferase
MLQSAITGQHAAPMPARISPWAVYDVFTVKDGEQIFLAAVSDAQWAVFCDVLGLADLKADPSYASNNLRVQAREPLLAQLRSRMATRSAAELSAILEAAGLPFAPISRPEDLFADPHLLATGGLADIRLPDGDKAGQLVPTTLFPFTLDGQRLGVRLDPPRLGEHTHAVLSGLGLSGADIDSLVQQRAVA